MIIEGKDILLYIKDHEGVWTATSCAKNCTINIKSKLIEITNPNTHNWKEYIPEVNSWSVQGNGLVNYNKRISANYFHNAIIQGDIVMFKFRAWDGNSTSILSGNGYLNATKQSAPAKG